MSPAGGVPRSAVLHFELELVDLQKGVPEGYMFLWLGDSPDPLFPAMDLNGDKEVPLEEVSRQACCNQLDLLRKVTFGLITKNALLSVCCSFQPSLGSKLKREKVDFGQGLMLTASLRTCLITWTKIEIGRSKKLNSQSTTNKRKKMSCKGETWWTF